MDILKLNPCGRLSFARNAQRGAPKSYIPPSEVQPLLAGVVAHDGLAEAVTLFDTLGLSKVSNLQNSQSGRTRASRGSLGISSAGRVLVRDSAVLLQEHYGKCRLSFLTLTLPPQALAREVLRNWSEISRKLRQWLAYHLELKGLVTHIVGVTEIQEDRQAEAGSLPCLHWHLLFVGRHSRGSWAVTPKMIDCYWKSLLQQYSKTQVPIQSACKLQRIESSASGYLGKYMSKGAKAAASVDSEYLPSSWYMCTRKLLQWRNKRVIRCEGDVAKAIWGWVLNNPGVFRFSRFVEIEAYDGQPLCLGWYGEFVSRQDYHDFSSMVHAFRSAVRVL